MSASDEIKYSSRDERKANRTYWFVPMADRQLAIIKHYALKKETTRFFIVLSSVIGDYTCRKCRHAIHIRLQAWKKAELRYEWIMSSFVIDKFRMA